MRRARSVVVLVMVVIATGCGTSSTASSPSTTDESTALTVKVDGKSATLQQMADALIATEKQVSALKAQLAADEQAIHTLRTATRAIGDRAGCGYSDMAGPLCPVP